MPRLFGCICNHPERLIPALEPVRHALVASAPVSRWGLGYVQSDEVLLSRTPRRSDEDVDFYEVLKRVRSDYIIGHAATEDGWSGNDNTQPFRYRRWLFAQDVTVPDTTRLQPLVAERIPDFLRRSIKGKTPAEHLFYVFLSVLHERSAIDDVHLPLADIRSALTTTVSRMEALMKEAGSDQPVGNLMACNSRTLMAVRQGEPLYMRRLIAPGQARSSSSRAQSTFKGILVVSATDHPGEGFEEIPPRSALLLSREVRPEVISLQA